MGVTAPAKKAVKSLWNHYQAKASQEKFSRSIQRHMRLNTDGDIPELPAEKKREIEAYWKQYGISLSTIDWHRYYYAKTGLDDPRFVPDDVFHRIIRPKLNDIHMAAAWSDKAFTDWVVRDVKTVRSVVRCVNGRLLDEQYALIDRKTANAIMNEHEKLVLKPTMFTDTGKNVVLQAAPFDIDAIVQRYGKFFVVQIPLQQHPDLARLNESSVNTVRIDTVLFDQEAHAVSAFAKAGQPGDFTDNGGGGDHRIFLGIRNGRFTDYGCDHDCNKFYEIPSGYVFAGQEVPFFREMCAAVEKAHKHVPHFGLAFWDVSVDQNGEPTIVEMNLRYPDSYIPQISSGPFFGEYTEDVLNYLRRA